MGTLYISDLDGTLLNDEACLSPYARQKLEEMITEGLLFTVASARNVISIRSALLSLPLRLPVVGTNGAFVSDLATGRHEIIRSIKSKSVTAVLEMSNQLPLPFVSTHENGQDRLYCPPVENPGMAWYLDDRSAHQDPRLRPMEKRPDRLESIVCLSFIDSRDRLEDFRRTLASIEAISTNLFDNDYSPGWSWLTVLSARATKANAIRALRRNHHLEHCRLVVFGDQLNDLPMFEIADHAVAVENAVAELKAAADETIGSFNEDAVVRYIGLNGKR